MSAKDAIGSRPYQESAVRNLREYLLKYGRVLAVAPTGSGKTVIGALLIKRTPRWRKVLWLAHRYELIDQAHAALASVGVEAGVMMAQDERLHGDKRRDVRARVQVASVPTIDRRGVPSGTDLIVFDEAHRVMADSYQRIAASASGAHVIGLTATPCRVDGKGLGEFFAYLHVVAQPEDLQEQGYLARPRTFTAGRDVLTAITTGLNGAVTSAGDYTHASMAVAVERRALIGKVVSEAMRIAPAVPKVVFACSVRHSNRLASEFRLAGVTAWHLDGKTPADERERILNDLRAGRVEVVCNVDVLSEGWDLPNLGAVVIARPTKSLARWLQMTGRVQRTYGNKQPFVIDHGANVERFDVLPGMNIPWSLNDGAKHGGRNDSGARIKVCQVCNAAMARSADECPECSTEMPAVPAIKEVEMQLHEVTAADLRRAGRTCRNCNGEMNGRPKSSVTCSKTCASALQRAGARLKMSPYSERPFEIDGVLMTVGEVAAKLGVTVSEVTDRRSRGHNVLTGKPCMTCQTRCVCWEAHNLPPPTQRWRAAWRKRMT